MTRQRKLGKWFVGWALVGLDGEILEWWETRKLARDRLASASTPSGTRVARVRVMVKGVR